MWEKFGKPGNGMIRDAREDVFEPDERIDSDALTGSHKTPQHCGGLAAVITAKEDPVIAAHCYAADRALGGVVVNLEIAVLAVADAIRLTSELLQEGVGKQIGVTRQMLEQYAAGSLSKAGVLAICNDPFVVSFSRPVLPEGSQFLVSVRNTSFRPGNTPEESLETSTEQL